MSDNKLLMEELKYLVLNDLSLNEYIIEQLQERFSKDTSLIIELYQILQSNKLTVPFFKDIEATIYNYLVSKEMSDNRTYYGATLYVAEMFETTQIYIKCKVNETRRLLISDRDMVRETQNK